MELIFIPETLSTASFIGLIAISCFTSMLTAAIGIGGGTVLLAIMAQVLPVKAIVPIHGVVQLGSNLGRAAIMLPQLNISITLWFLLGSVVGAIAGGQLVVSLPVAILQGLLGGFILYSVWGPKIPGLGDDYKSLIAGGFLSTLLTMFIGATGPFVLAVLRTFNFHPQMLVATSAACLVIQHLLKVVVFGFLGFAFAPYLPLVVLMIASGFIGTVIGRRILIKVDPEKFKRGLNIVLTLLALRLLFSAISS